MATTGRKLNASDEIFDFLCSPCNKKGKNNEAVKYCADCLEYLCDNCVENHNSFSALAGHKLVGKIQFGNTSGADSRDLPSVPTERCKVHTMKLMDMYCVDHDSVGCHVCFTINHKPCQNIHYIPEYVEKTNQLEHIRNVKDKAVKKISELSNLIDQKQKAREDNNNSRKACFKQIKEFRDEINQTLDRLEQASIAEINETFNNLDKKYQDELIQVQETLDALTERKTEIERSQKNLSQLFISTKMCEALTIKSEKCESSPVDTKEKSPTFARNTEMVSLLKKLDTLGERPRIRKTSLYEVQSSGSCVQCEIDRR